RAAVPQPAAAKTTTRWQCRPARDKQGAGTNGGGDRVRDCEFSDANYQTAFPGSSSCTRGKIDRFKVTRRGMALCGPLSRACDTMRRGGILQSAASVLPASRIG